MSRQASQLAYASPNVQVEVRSALADKIVELSGLPFTGVALTSGGGEAVELAIEIARHCTRRSGIVSFRGCYHGCGPLSGLLGAEFDEPVDSVRQAARGRQHIVQCALPLSPRDVRPSLNELKELLSHLPEPPAAVIVEPIVGVNGFYVLPRDFLQALQKISAASGAMLIFDEVLTGFWRTGQCFAFQALDCIPDAVCVGKGLTSGYVPLSGVLLSDQWRLRLAKDPLPWATTNWAHPVACAAALSVLRELSQFATQARLRGLVSLVWRLAEGLMQRMPNVITEVRGKGLLLALQLSDSLVEDDRELRVRRMARLQQLLYEQGVLVEIEPTIGVVPVAPPLVVSHDQLRLAFRSIEAAFNDMVIQKRTSDRP